MKKWEDSIKDRLEGYESPLPEGSLAEFRALREGKAASPARKLAPWIWALTAAAAAGLAAVLFLRQPSVPDEGIQFIQQPVATVAVMADSTLSAEPLPSTQLIAQAVAPQSVPQVTLRTRKTIQPAESAEPAELEESAEPEEATEAAVAVPAAAPDEESAQPALAKEETSPFLPESARTRPVTMRVGPAAGIVAGSGLVAAWVVPTLTSGQTLGAAPGAVPGDILALADYGYFASLSSWMAQDVIKEYTHYFPLKTGLSTRIPVASRLYVTTGLEYSLYRSNFQFSQAGVMKQTAQYLGIPLRVDWLIASGKVLDVYAGAGVQGDLCVAATIAGEKIQKDGASLSLLGAGGIQLNMTKHLGLYVEPQLSWRIPSEHHTLETYRSAHPLMFSVAAGLRINLDK